MFKSAFIICSIFAMGNILSASALADEFAYVGGDKCGFNDCTYYYKKNVILDFPDYEGDDQGKEVTYSSMDGKKLLCRLIDQEFHEDVYKCGRTIMLMLAYRMHDDGVTEIREAHCDKLSPACWRSIVRAIKVVP